MRPSNRLRVATVDVLPLRVELAPVLHGAMNGVGARLRLGYRIEDGFVPCGDTVNNSDL